MCLVAEIIVFKHFSVGGVKVVQECAEAVARHYLDRKRHRPAHSMKIEVVDTATMDTGNEYEIRRGF